MEIPAWLNAQVLDVCPYCGSRIVNNEALTDRYCSNTRCVEHMAHKIDVLAKRFGIKNFGVATARQYIARNKFIRHTEIIPYWFDTKPSLYLHEVGEICLIKGHQKKWREYCDGCDTMLDVLAKPSVPADVKRKTTLLICTEKLVSVKPRLLGSRVNVMLSGSFNGYRSRSMFVGEMNRKYGEVVQLVDVGKRKTDVMFLVKKSYTTDHEKSAIARERGIQIVSPAELEERIKVCYTYIIEGRKPV